MTGFVLRSVIITILAVLMTCGISRADYQYFPVSIQTRDGKYLAADVYHWGDLVTRKPVILVQTPYNKDLYHPGQDQPPQSVAIFPKDEKYNYVIVDWRGFFGSADAAVPGYDRGLDGADVIAWILQQPWSNRRVGTFGGSALGYIQYQTAFHDPEGLICMVPLVRDFKQLYFGYYYGGVYRKEHVESLDLLRLADSDLILQHPSYDNFWKLTELTTDIATKIKVPCLVIGGWFDHYPDPVLRSFDDLVQKSDPGVRMQHRLIYGPWLHGGVGVNQQGVMTYPGADNVQSQALRFFDFHLAQIPNDWPSQPVVQYYQMGENKWIGASSLSGIPRQPLQLYLSPGGGLLPHPQQGSPSPRAYIYDPMDPTPVVGGSRFNVLDRDLPDGPQDISQLIDLRSDVLTYTTAPFKIPFRINGETTATIYASTNRTDTDFCIRMSEVYPDGRSIILTQGIVRGRYNASLSNPALLSPGVVYPFEIKLQNLAQTIMPGNRLRMSVSSAAYPHFDRNLNNGGPLYQPGIPLLATNSVYSDTTRRSVVTVNLLPTELPLAKARLAMDAVPVSIPDAVVTAVFSESGIAYVQAPDRSSGLRVTGNISGLQVGSAVSLAGKMSSELTGERVLQLTSSVNGSASVVEPFRCSVRSLWCEPLDWDSENGSGQPGFPNGSGVNVIGQFVSITGRVTSVQEFSGYAEFVIDDGSGQTVTCWQYGSVAPLSGSFGNAEGVLSLKGQVGTQTPCLLVTALQTDP